MPRTVSLLVLNFGHRPRSQTKAHRYNNNIRAKSPAPLVPITHTPSDTADMLTVKAELELVLDTFWLSDVSAAWAFRLVGHGLSGSTPWAKQISIGGRYHATEGTQRLVAPNMVPLYGRLVFDDRYWIVAGPV